ncbi:MAG: hypothetical protein ABSE93_16270 [Terriglobia bacterium]|jgi:hypothetical protein
MKGNTLVPLVLAAVSVSWTGPSVARGGPDEVRGISQSDCLARAGHLVKVLDDWTQGGRRHVEYNTENFWKALGLKPDDSGSQFRLLQYFVNEDGRSSVPPLRTGCEVRVYQRIKEFVAKRGAGERLGIDRLLTMGLDSCADSSGNANLQIVLLTIHNVERLLARPDAWLGDNLDGSRPGTNEAGHPASDPAYPMIRDMLGFGSSGGKMLPELLNVPRRRQADGPLRPAGQVLITKYTENLYDPSNGVFDTEPGAASAPAKPAESAAEWNGGCHYYFWLGATARTTLGEAVVLGGLRGEMAAKMADNKGAQGAVEVSDFVCGAMFGSEAFKARSKFPPLPGAAVWVLQKPEFEINDPNTNDFVSGNTGSTPTSHWQIDEKGLTFQSKKDGFHLEAVWNQPPPRIRQGDTFVLRIEVTAEGPRKVQASLSPAGPISEWDVEPLEHAGVTQPGPNALLLTLPNGPDNSAKTTATLAANITLSGAGGTVNLATGEGSGARRKVTVNTLFLQVNINNYAKLYWTYLKEGAKPGSF